VLNLGAHHGLLGRRLRQVPGVELVVDAEAAAGLLAQCDGPCVQADEEALPFAAQSFDLVVSGLALQHVNDLPGTLIQVRRALQPDGLLLAALLGGATLNELRTSLLAAEEEVEGGASPRVAPFADVRDLGALLQRARFALPVVDADTVTVTYPHALALMRELRAMGATNVLHARRRSPLRRATLARALEIYAQRFGLANGRVPATFEIMTLTGWAPHESQQKPLQPGTAKMRLAEALGTQEQKADDKAGPRR
jgi:SAM-dependent methyltransferase